MKKILKIALFCSLFLLTACPNPPPAEEPCNFVQNSLNRRVSWARTPIRIWVDESILSIDVGERDKYVAFRSLLQAIEFWNDQFDTPVFEPPTGITTDLAPPVIGPDGRVAPDGYNAIYVVGS